MRTRPASPLEIRLPTWVTMRLRERSVPTVGKGIATVEEEALRSWNEPRSDAEVEDDVDEEGEGVGFDDDAVIVLLDGVTDTLVRRPQVGLRPGIA